MKPFTLKLGDCQLTLRDNPDDPTSIALVISHAFVTQVCFLSPADALLLGSELYQQGLERACLAVSTEKVEVSRYHQCKPAGAGMPRAGDEPDSERS